MDQDEESPSGAFYEKDGNDFDTTMLGDHRPAVESQMPWCIMFS